MMLVAWCLSGVTGGLGAWAGWWARGLAAERRAYDAEIAGYEAVLAERQAPRHAKGEPLPAPASAREPNPPSPGRGSRPVQPSPPWGTQERLAAAVNRHPATRGKRLVTTAADIGPVFVPRPGTVVPMRPQPARTSGTGTVTMPRLTDTGELRAAGDMLIARMREDQAAWEAQFHAECEADRTHRTEELAR